MKRFLIPLLILLWTTPAWPFTASLNFRGTSGYVTDGSGQTPVLPGDSFPTTRNGITFGFVIVSNSTTGDASAVVSPVDRNSSVDPRFAGIVYAAPGGASNVAFAIQVPSAGDYDIRLAIGDSGFDQSGQQEYVELLNGEDQVGGTTGSSLGIILNAVTGPTQNKYYDATGVLRTSESDWISNNIKVTKTVSAYMGTTTLVIWLGKDALSSYTILAHVEVSDATGGGPTAAPRRRIFQQ